MIIMVIFWFKRNPKKKKGKSFKCVEMLEDQDNKKRVGAVIITRENFGPGVYVLAYVPKTKAKEIEDMF